MQWGIVIETEGIMTVEETSIEEEGEGMATEVMGIEIPLLLTMMKETC